MKREHEADVEVVSECASLPPELWTKVAMHLEETDVQSLASFIRVAHGFFECARPAIDTLFLLMKLTLPREPQCSSDLDAFRPDDTHACQLMLLCKSTTCLFAMLPGIGDGRHCPYRAFVSILDLYYVNEPAITKKTTTETEGAAPPGSAPIMPYNLAYTLLSLLDLARHAQTYCYTRGNDGKLVRLAVPCELRASRIDETTPLHHIYLRKTVVGRGRKPLRWEFTELRDHPDARVVTNLNWSLLRTAAGMSDFLNKTYAGHQRAIYEQAWQRIGVQSARALAYDILGPHALHVLPRECDELDGTSSAKFGDLVMKKDELYRHVTNTVLDSERERMFVFTPSGGLDLLNGHYIAKERIRGCGRRVRALYKETRRALKPRSGRKKSKKFDKESKSSNFLLRGRKKKGSSPIPERKRITPYCPPATGRGSYDYSCMRAHAPIRPGRLLFAVKPAGDVRRALRYSEDEYEDSDDRNSESFSTGSRTSDDEREDSDDDDDEEDDEATIRFDGSSLFDRLLMNRPFRERDYSEEYSEKEIEEEKEDEEEGRAEREDIHEYY